MWKDQSAGRVVARPPPNAARKGSKAKGQLLPYLGRDRLPGRRSKYDEDDTIEPVLSGKRDSGPDDSPRCSAEEAAGNLPIAQAC